MGSRPAPRLTFSFKHCVSRLRAQSQSQPYRLDWARGRDADYASIKLAEINALAKKHLGRENAAQVAILPEKAPEK